MRRLIGAGALGLGLAAACSSQSKPHGLTLGGSGGSAGGGGTGIILDSGEEACPGPPDPSAFCGSQIVPVAVNRPNLYFVLDASGSMSDGLPGSTYDKYDGARVAIAQVLRAIGHRVSYGAAIFPLPGGPVDGCGPGDEIFAVSQGDPASCASSGIDGPVLKSFLAKTGGVAPSGGTSTSATLTRLTPSLEALSGKTVVILATDGAPNCNLTLTCGPADCEYNIEGYAYQGVPCVAPVNCCDNAMVAGGSYQCVDRDASVAAITTLHDAGIDTYVIGMPGAEPYVEVLDAMADAGGTARPSEPRYYAAADSDALTGALTEIGVNVAISCDIQLDEKPADPNLVNVYFDSTEQTYDAVDGWSWSGPQSITLNGAACQKLKSGDVLQVQVVAGCPTVVK